MCNKKRRPNRGGWKDANLTNRTQGSGPPMKSLRFARGGQSDNSEICARPFSQGSDPTLSYRRRGRSSRSSSDQIALIWPGYTSVWLEEPFITVGFCLGFLGLVFFKQPLVTRRHAGSGGTADSSSR
ncbi:hypothetical protein OKW27_007428 [Paraburkholderia sp. 35.1]